MKSENNEITPLQNLKNRQKKLMLEELRKTPIIQFVCQKYNVPRSTFYRWMNKNRKFKKAVNDALKDGDGLINDLAVSHTISKIKDGDKTMIIFWLKNKHTDFSEIKYVSSKRMPIDENPMTPEKAAEIARALKKWIPKN